MKAVANPARRPANAVLELEFRPHSAAVALARIRRSDSLAAAW